MARAFQLFECLHIGGPVQFLAWQLARLAARPAAGAGLYLESLGSGAEWAHKSGSLRSLFRLPVLPLHLFGQAFPLRSEPSPLLPRTRRGRALSLLAAFLSLCR